MEPIRLIRDPSELRGTCYFEFLPGEYRGKCWNDGSVFLAEDVFGLIEPTFKHNEPLFDHYDFMGIRKQTWDRITADLERLERIVVRARSLDDLRGEVHFSYTPSAEAFARDFKANADALAEMTRHLVVWLREQLRKHECVSVLGM